MFEPEEKVSLKPGTYKCLDDPHQKFYVESSIYEVEVVVIKKCNDKIIANASKNPKNPVRIEVRYDQIAA